MNAIDQLRQARMEKKLTLEQVAHETKIPIRYLEAIEENRLNQLPKSDLTTMYLRAYAEFLLLSPEPILALYDQSVQSDSPPSRQPEPSKISRRGQKSIHQLRKPWLWISVSSLLFIVLIGATWFAIDYETNDTSVNEQQAITTHETKKVSSFKFPTMEDRAKLELIEPMELNNKSDRYQVANVEKIEVTLIANKPTTIEIGQNNQVVKKDLQENEKVNLTDHRSIFLRINQPSFVSLSVNGITVESANPSKVASYQFELQNARE